MQELKAIDKRYDTFGEIFLYGIVNGWCVVARKDRSPCPMALESWISLSKIPVGLFDDLPSMKKAA